MSDLNQSECSESEKAAELEILKPALREAWGDINRDGTIDIQELSGALSSNPQGQLGRFLRTEAVEPIQIWQISERVLRAIEQGKLPELPESMRLMIRGVSKEDAEKAIQSALQIRINAAKQTVGCNLNASATTIADSMLENSFTVSDAYRQQTIKMKENDLQAMASLDDVRIEANMLLEALLTTEELEQIEHSAEVQLGELRATIELLNNEKQQRQTL